MRTVDERNSNLSRILRETADRSSKGIRVAVPGFVQEWDADTQTVTVQPAIKEKISFSGKIMEVVLPLLVDVPVVMPRAGGYSLVFAPKPGDECLVIFADMCIDAWWQSGGVESQADTRRHDLSDGFAVLGCWSQVNKPKIPESGCRLQNDEGTAGVSIDGTNVDIFGTVTINGAAYSSHRHSVSEGAGQTGGVA